MKNGIGPLWLRAVIFYIILSLLPPLAMADQGVRLISAPHAFIIPLQEEGSLNVVIKKPWYKKWWVWAIVIGVAGGIAASSQGQDAPTKPVPVIE